jgi:hypothetical protein
MKQFYPYFIKVKFPTIFTLTLVKPFVKGLASTKEKTPFREEYSSLKGVLKHDTTPLKHGTKTIALAVSLHPESKQCRNIGILST